MKKMFRSIGVAALMLATIPVVTGCFDRKTTVINTPALYNVSKDANGNLQTNMVSPASVEKTVEKERLLLPTGYIARAEEDFFGMKLQMTSESSTLPDIVMGEMHSSHTLIPTSTNRLYTAALSVNGSIDNKAVPFWISSKGSFTAGDAYVTQTTDTNGTSSTAGASAPGTPTPQQTK